MKSRVDIIRKVVDLLAATLDVYVHYVTISLPLWDENKKQAIRIYNLERTIHNNVEECEREIFFLRQSIIDLKKSALLLPKVTADIFSAITKGISDAQNVLNTDHHNTITKVWRLNNEAAELNKNYKTQLAAVKKEVVNSTNLKAQIKEMASQIEQLSLDKQNIKLMVQELTHEISGVTQFEITKLCWYLDNYYQQQLRKLQALTTYRAKKRNHTFSKRHELENTVVMDDVVLLEE